MTLQLTIDSDLGGVTAPLRRDVPGDAGEVAGVLEPGVYDDQVAFVGDNVIGVALVHQLLVLQPVDLRVWLTPGWIASVIIINIIIIIIIIIIIRAAPELELSARGALVGVGRGLELLLEEGHGDQRQPGLDVALSAGGHAAAVVIPEELLHLVPGDPPPGLGDPDPGLGVHVVLGDGLVLDLVLALD